MNEFYTKLDEYYDKFNDVFPTMEYQSLTEEETIELIDKCIKENKTIQQIKPTNYNNEINY